MEPLSVLRDPDTLDLPFTRPNKAGDVGYDLPTAEETVIPPFGMGLAPTDVRSGLRVKLPEGTWGLIVMRSGTYAKYPTLALCNAPIDAGYTGPLGPRFRNIGSVPVRIPRGERLVQLVIMPALTPAIQTVEAMPETERGGSRFGSTGK